MKNWALWGVLLAIVILPAVAFAQSDTTAPILAGLSFNPTTVDVTAGPQTVTVTAHVTDDLSGFNYMYGYLYSPSNNQYQYFYIGGYDYYRVSGDIYDGYFQNTLTIPQFAEAGIWTVNSLYIWDNAGNQRVFNSAAALQAAGISISLDVIDNQQDITPPKLTSVSINPGTIDVSTGARDVTVTFGVTDDLSGLSLTDLQTYVSAYAPSYSQSEGPGTVKLDSGNINNGMFEATIKVPQYSAPGSWQIYIYLTDNVGNRAYYYPWSNWPANPTLTTGGVENP